MLCLPVAQAAALIFCSVLVPNTALIFNIMMMIELKVSYSTGNDPLNTWNRELVNINTSSYT